MNEVTILIPQTLDLDKIIAVENLNSHSGFHKDKLAYLVYIINRVGSQNSDTYEEEEGWVPLRMELLRIVAKDATLYYEILQKHKVVTINRQYIVGVQARKYKLRSPYNHAPLVHYEITNRATRHAIREVIRQFDVLNQAELEDYEHLTKWYNYKLQIDIATARTFCDTYHKHREASQKAEQTAVIQEWFDQMSTGGVEGPANEFEEHRENKRWRKAYDYAIKRLEFGIDSIQKQDYSLKIDKTSFRLHGPLTMLKSELRYLLKYDGQSLVSLDLKNSQPYFSLMLINSKFWDDQTAEENSQSINNTIDLRRKLSRKLNTIAKKRVNMLINSTILDKITTQHRALIMMSKWKILTTKKVFRSTELYISEVLKGTIYEYMATQWNKLHPVYIGRGGAKKMMFLTLFSSNQFFAQRGAEGKRLFHKLFPLVAEVFRTIKISNKPLLAILLQTLESHVFLKVITKRISDENPNVPLFTIHDSILTTTGNEAYVKRIMEEELEKFTGYKPAIEEEHYTKEAFEESVLKY